MVNCLAHIITVVPPRFNYQLSTTLNLNALTTPRHLSTFQISSCALRPFPLQHFGSSIAGVIFSGQTFLYSHPGLASHAPQTSSNPDSTLRIFLFLFARLDSFLFNGTLPLSGLSFAMHNALLTPPTTPPPKNCPPTLESRIGLFLGESLQLKSILGTGAYGVVYSAVDHYTGNWYAVKALSKTTPNGQPLDKRQKEFQAREIQLHYAASAHPNIVSMLKIVDDVDCTYVILEYCPEGDLFANITERCRYVNNDALVRRAFLQILDAVEHCHRLGIYHRDLKPENILVSNSGSDVLLADFGLATTDLESEDHGCGSTFYMSPGKHDISSF